MARMDRLFGVTMAERGVSQIVSVELAERLLDVGRWVMAALRKASQGNALRQEKPRMLRAWRDHFGD